MTKHTLALAVLATAVAASFAASTTAQQTAAAAVAIEPDRVPAEDLAAAVKDPSWKAPRTSWGEPALEGTYSSDDMRSVPRERPENIGTREKLTAEEFAERAKKDAEERDRILNKSSYSATAVGTRTFGYSSQIIDPPNGRMPAKTPNAVPRLTRGSYSGGPYDDFGDFTLYDRCITRGLGSLIPSPAIYGNGIVIAQSPGLVTITHEMVHETRFIPIGRTDRLDTNVRQYLGTSRGRWDGDTLVVETEGFTDKTNIGDVQNSTAMRLTERFRRVSPDMIEYVGTVTDPAVYTAPFTYRLMLTASPGYRVYEYSCHEGNSVVANSLSGEREYERQVAAALRRGEKPPEHPRDDNLGPLPTDDAAFINLNKGQ
jgi:hypothetical protein